MSLPASVFVATQLLIFVLRRLSAFSGTHVCTKGVQKNAEFPSTMEVSEGGGFLGGLVRTDLTYESCFREIFPGIRIVRDAQPEELPQAGPRKSPSGA